MANASTGRTYRRSPDQELKGWPGGVPYIIGNEASERFSFYGMKAILFQYLTTLYVAGALAQDAAEKHATHDVHLFIAGVYALPMVGAIIADKLLGKYLTIFSLSLVYCAGHGVLALAEGSLTGMHLGLGLIAIGSGGIKSCVSANVGDQFGKANWHLTKKVYQIFYFSINFGSLFSTMLTPWLLKHHGPSVAFGVPGVLMLLATLIFFAGRYQMVHVPARPGGKLGALDSLIAVLLFTPIAVGLFGDGIIPYWAYPIAIAAGLGAGGALFAYRLRLQPDDGFLATVLFTVMRGVKGARERLGEESIEGMRAVFRIMFIFFWVSIFWALFDQHSSTWIKQASMMDLHFLGATWLPSQTSSMNPLFVLIIIPLLTFGVFPWLEHVGIKITPLRRMTVGMFLAAGSFVAVALVQRAVDAAPGQVSIGWQIVPYAIMTLGEVLVSATGLEFAYTQAPRRVKATVMACWSLTVAFGNKLVAVVALIEGLSMENFFWLFAGLSAVSAVIFGIVAYFYTYREYTQE